MAITTADPFAPPAIQAGYLASDRDLDVLEAACARTLRFADAPPLCHHIRGRHLPRDTSADALRRHIREELVTTYHPTSTCRMGDGPHAVVDPELRVRGVEGLRVADASIMPTITRGNTHAPTVMIAETASDLIRGRPAPAPAPV